MVKLHYGTIANDDDDDDSSFHPAKSANFFSLWTFWWMNSIFRTGSQRPLIQSDFLPLNEEDRTRDLTEKLEEKWNNHIQQCNITAGRKPKLWKCVLKMISCKEALFILSFWFIESIYRVLTPLVLGVLLVLLNATEKDYSLVYVCCFILGMRGVVSSITHYSAFKCELLGMRLSSALKGLVYHKILLILQQTLLETTTGNIIDLVSNDVQRMEMAPRMVVVSSFCIFEFISICVLVSYFIGWQAIMGILFLIVLIPCVMTMASVSARLRPQIAKLSDIRISLMNELVKGIRAIKTHVWEEYYQGKVKEARRNETWIIVKKNTTLALIQGMSFTSRSPATFLSILTLILTGNFVSSAVAFTFLSFINVLTVTIARLISSAPPLLELFVSLKRIEHFLLLENIPFEPLKSDQTSCNRTNSYPQLSVRDSSQKEYLPIKSAIHQDVLPEKTNLHLKVSSLTCKINEQSEKFLLRNVSFVARDNSLTVITGQVGSGKSTLLATIAGEVIKTSGNITCSGIVAYVPQKAWIFSGTLKENVLFGEPYVEKKYAEVLETCALMEDVNRFPNGDQTFVGEQGVVLSGGQRARVNLARAVYADADIYLLDDPLSAVDVKVGEHIFKQCLCKLLRDKIKILVTYAENCMKGADQVMILHKGSVEGKGSFRELQDAGKILETIKDTSASTKKQMTPGTRKGKDTPLTSFNDVSVSFDENLEVSEETTTGKLSWTVYWNYFKTGNHPLVVVLFFLFFLLTQAILVAPDVWLAFVTKMSWKSQQSARTIGIYAILTAAVLIFGITRACAFFKVLLRSVNKLHDIMVSCLLHAPVLFFDTNPAGRILDRCSKDINCLDELLPVTFVFTAQAICYTLACVLLPAFLNIWLLAVTLPLLFVLAYLTWYYLNTSRELKRIESITRSPVYSHFSETMAGLSTIRTRKKQNGFVEQFYRRQDLHNQALYMVSASAFWLGVRADLLCSVLIAGVALFAVFSSENPAFTGLALTYAIQTAKLLQFAVRNFSDVENFMTSVERIKTYVNLDPEPGYKIKTLPPVNWPHVGHVSFRGVSLRYYPGGPQVLENLTFDIQEKIKIGIVGRTGDGKSSIVAALLRMPEDEGEILIDDVPIKSIQLQELRKCISVLSQSPVLLSGTLRKNLDPLEKHRDDELWNALKEVELTSLVESLEGHLDYELLERGENLSVGERQLICMARTLLQQSKIVILDEPTAHVDPNTETTIWNTVHDKLKNSTVITIAHRLNTVKDCDVILVLKEGQVVEFDSIDVLLSREGGIFYSMFASQNLLS